MGVTVRMMLRNKSIQGITKIGPETTIITAMHVMRNKNIGSLIIEKDDIFLGIVTDRDIATKVEIEGDDPQTSPVSRIMTPEPKVVTVTMEAELEDCLVLMIDGDFRHLPVVDSGKIVGMISVKDVGREIINRGYLADQIRENFPVS